MIEVKHLTKSFGDSVVLENINVSVNKGDVVAVIGPSGAGKSTFVRCLNLLNEPTKGQIFIDGEEITARNADVSRIRQKIGMVFQDFNLFKNLTILENAIVAQVDVLGRDRQEACDKAVECLKMVGLGDKYFSYPEMLSGGQQQRAAIARTLSMDPEIILFDEPTSALDPTLVGEVEYIIKKLANMGNTMIIVTHDMTFAKNVSNRVFYMDEKGIYEDGTTDQIFNHPVKEKTQRFIKKVRQLDLKIVSDNYSMPEIVSQISTFASFLNLSARTSTQMQMLIEELCIQIMVSQMKAGEEILATFEASSKKEEILLNINYSGEPINIDNADVISYEMVRHIAQKLDCVGNHISAVIKM